MRTYLDEPFAKVWVDEAIPCVFTIVKEPLDKFQLDTLAELELLCVKKLKKKNTEVFSLVNLQQCQTSMEKTIVNYMNRTVRGQFHIGLAHKLVVTPENKITRASFMTALQLYQDVKIEVFNSFEGALDAIKMHRAYKSFSAKPRKTILEVILERIGLSGETVAEIGREKIV
jgi:hypothetical protein